MLSKLKPHTLFILLLSVSAGILIYFSYYNEFYEGGPDTIWHYYFSKYALYNTQFFLHHWGKPFFILLSTWFAQFGFFGIKIFNVLCGSASAIIAYKILQHLRVPYKWSIVPLLIFSPLYFIILQSSLTEPLFSLILISGIYLYFKNKYLPATILLSFLLFSRSEGSFMLVCFAAYLGIMKQWKYLPFFLTAFVLYAIAGVLMGHNFFWYFKENPYEYISPYGHGHFMDILNRYKDIWGLPFTIALCLAGSITLFLYFKEKQFIFWKPANETAQLFYLVFIPAAVFTAFHLYAWHFGLFGSAGLERVLACVFPCFAVLTIWAFNKILLSKIPKSVSLSLLLIFLFFHIQTPFRVFSYPLKAYGRQKALMDAGKWFITSKPDSSVIFYVDPTLIFQMNKNPFDKNLNREQFAFDPECKQQETLPAYFFWDSQYSDQLCNKKQADVEKCDYKNIKEFTDEDQLRIIVYEKLPEPIQK